MKPSWKVLAAIVVACLADAAYAQQSQRTDWLRTGRSRYSWAWLSERFDQNHDGSVSREELRIDAETFARMDRSWDDKLTEVDFDWTKEGVLGKQKETTFALFKSVDKDSDGRLTAEEWEKLFAKMAGEKGYLQEEELERLMYLPRVVKSAREESLRLGDSEFSPNNLHIQDTAPKPGEEAPDFELKTADGKGSIRLSSFRGKKPVVLIFGCFSCGNYRTYSETVEALHQRWKNDFEFVRVYVREAHPVSDDQVATSTNAAAGILVKQPKTYDERCELAGRFAESLRITTSLVVDGIDNRVGIAYEGWPDRLYLVDQDGVVVFAGGPGPFAFNPRELEQSMIMLSLDQHQN